jgi:phage terminase large subunit-like protein
VPIDQVLQKLNSLPKEEALAVLEALEAKRREKNFIKYWSPTDPQKEVLKNFTADKKIFGILGGNRSGKTETGVFLDVAWALGKEYFRGESVWEIVKDLPIPEPPNNVWIVGLDFNAVRDVIWNQKLKQGTNHPSFLPKDPSVVRKANDGDFQIFFENGSIITCKSADSGREKFQGASVDLVHIDEEPEEEIFNECYQRTVDCAGKILVTLTPLKDSSSGVRTPWVFDLHSEWKKGKKNVHFSQLSVLDNPHVPQEEKDEQIEKWAGHYEERARLYGDFIQRSGLVYPMWGDKHLIRPFNIPREWTRLVSIDPAPTGVTAAIWAAVSPQADLYFYREYYERDQIVSQHAKAISMRNSGDPIDYWIIDPKAGAQRNAETHRSIQQLYRESGIPVRLAEVGEDYGLETLREYLTATITEGSRHPKAFFFDNLYNFRDEIKSYVWANFNKGDLKGLSKEKPLKRNDHLLNATQYLSAMRPRWRRRESPSPDTQRRSAILNSYT